MTSRKRFTFFSSGDPVLEPPDAWFPLQRG
jgi:hypothetical protein